MFRSIAMMGYAVVFISHSKEKTIKPKNAPEYNQICPSVQTSACSIIENMADLYGYAHVVEGVPVLTFRSSDNSVACGGHFKYIAAQVNLDYDDLVKALNEAIDKEASQNGNKFVTEERETATEVTEYDYDALMNEFQNIVGELMNKNQAYYAPRVTQIIDTYLGKGKKISETTRDQGGLIFLIVDEIKSTLLTENK